MILPVPWKLQKGQCEVFGCEYFLWRSLQKADFAEIRLAEFFDRSVVSVFV